MYLTALIEEIRKNPERYEGKEYKSIKETYKVIDGKLMWLYPGTRTYKVFHGVKLISINEQVQEIRQEVTLEEAVQEYNAGKTVICTIKYDDTTFDKTFDFNFMTSKYHFVKITDLLKLQKGKWYIKEDT